MTKALDNDATITKAIISVHKRSATLQMDIQRILVAICTRWAQTRDCRPAVAHINQLLTKGQLTALRTNSIREWVETYMGLTLDPEANAFMCPPAVTDGQHLDIKALTNARWWDFDGGEKPYVPLADPAKLLNQLLGKFEKDVQKLGEDSKVTQAQIDALKTAKLVEVDF